MFQAAPGATIPFPEKIKEDFQLIEHGIRFHISFEKLGAMLEDFLAQLKEPLFFVLQIPLSRDEEQALGNQAVRNPNASPHDKVCYLDGQSKEQVQDILRQYGALLLADGISQFGIASHATGDEMFIQKYKLVDIYCKEPQMYFDFMGKYGLRQTDQLLTVWQTFSQETPGKARSVKVDGLTAYDVYDALVELGMYIAKLVDG